MADASADIVSNIRELEKFASELKIKIRDVMPRRPIVIEFGGSPRSGKTQSISSLSVFLRRNKFSVFSTIEYASINPIINKFDPWFNVWTGCMSLCKLLETVSSKIVEHDFILIDRGIFDAVCWLHYHYKAGRLAKAEYETYVSFFCSNRWVSLISLVYVFRVAPDVSLEREYAYLLTRKAGSVMQEKILNSYNDAVQECIDLYGGAFSRIEQLDTSQKNQNQAGYIVTKATLEAVRNVLEEKIGYFRKNDIGFDDRGAFEFAPFAGKFPALNFESRIQVENDSGAVQPVAVAVIRNVDGTEVLTGVKNRKATKGRAPELNRTLCWFGGHVRNEDARLIKGGAKNYTATLKEAVRRELKEELDFDFIVADEPRLVVWDQDSESSRKHVAFVFDVVVDFSATKFHADAKEFNSEHISILSKSDYETNGGGLRTDSWSHAILQTILNWNARPLFAQTEFEFW